MLLDYLWDWISTHAPHAGSDTTSIRPMAACPNFNSRSPCRERPLVAGKEMLLLLFQSTLPMRGATMGTVPAVPGRLISTHAPHAGSDRDPGSRKVRHQISTHAPHAGSDFGSVFLCGYSEYFNPRSPCGERRSGAPPPRLWKYFNPRSPCGERLPTVVSSNGVPRNFNPRSPCGERPFPRSL